VCFGAKIGSDEGLIVLAKLLKGVFQQRRKKIRNALAGATNLNLSVVEADRILDSAGIDGTIKVDGLTASQFRNMADCLGPTGAVQER
jgi:16S rRNA A1518/A1519 N6-dimethyltransferase RsmA/KsgA/DIM1 with predicted DNA glycosylase/AP lyase activity